MTTNPARESLQDDSNPMHIEGVEYVEYRTAQPQQLGQVLELMGFRPIARHRSREVLLYRQGGMNIVINAHGGGDAQAVPLPAEPQVAAAHRRALTLGAWDVPSQVAPMELHIPAIHGVGTSRIYFVDRHREFSIYSVDFVPIPGVDPNPPALAGMRWFGIVQYIGAERTNDWVAFYQSLFGFTELGADRSTGVLPSGCVLASPDGSLQLQLIEPPADLDDGVERLHRLAFAAADVPVAAAALRERGVSFVQTKQLSVQPRGALTQAWLGSVMFELVHADAPQGKADVSASARSA
jgi:4-hydroxyphenylpyruvate dioxygenase